MLEDFRGGRGLAGCVCARRTWERSRLEPGGETVARKEEGMGPRAGGEHQRAMQAVLGTKGIDQPGCFHWGRGHRAGAPVWEWTPGALGSRPGRRGQYLPPGSPVTEAAWVCSVEQDF